MMTTTASLESLAQSIARQQSELEGLRKQLEARQTQLADLKSRKEVFEAQLRQLDAEIRVVSQGKTPSPETGKAAPAKTKFSSAPAPTPPPKKMAPAPANARPPKRMADLIVDIVSETKGLLTAKPIADELQRRGFFRTSPNLHRIVQVRVNELMREGILGRAEDRPGIVLGKAKSEMRASMTTTGGSKKPAKTAPSKSSRRAGSDGKVLLRPLLKELMARSQRPLRAKELAEMAIAKGYATGSKNLGNVVGVLLTRMPEVENVPGEGYRIKRV